MNAALAMSTPTPDNPAEPNSDGNRPRSPWAGIVWPAIVVVLLAGHVFIITGALLVSSATIPAAVTAPAGYAEALGWDEQQAAVRASAALGWTLAVVPTDAVELNGDRRIEFQLLDAAGLPIDGARLDATLYHHARPAASCGGLIAATDEPGRFAAVLPLKREGMWRLKASATRGEDRLIVDADFWLDSASQLQAPRLMPRTPSGKPTATQPAAAPNGGANR